MTLAGKIAVLSAGLLAYVAYSRSASAATGEGAPASSNAVPENSIHALVIAINDRDFGGWFDVADVMAIIEIESHFDARAFRAEPQINDASRGLMQVLLSTAKDRGFNGSPDLLFDPATNIRIGMAQLKWSWDFLVGRLGPANVSRSMWIGSYNAGVGNALKGYTPTLYVTKFELARTAWMAFGA